jgi:type II secretory pathway pseudopilin PulG
MYILKKGALFGIDARVALSVFGALSLISGAALYSAIKDARVTSFYNEIKELEKAIVAMQVDLGYYPYFATFYVNASGLQNNNMNDNNWKGPYYPITTYSGAKLSDTLATENIYNASISGKVTRGRSNFKCTGKSGSTVADMSLDKYFIVVTATQYGRSCESIDIDLLKAVHDKYDSDGNYSAGKIMVYDNSANGYPQFGGLYYQLDNEIFGYES